MRGICCRAVASCGRPLSKWGGVIGDGFLMDMSCLDASVSLALLII
jgi:hypothetical protein